MTTPTHRPLRVTATLRHGILILDSSGRQIAALNRNGDMPDNRVVHLSADKNGCIAATTPGAIVLFCNEVCATLFDSRNGLGTIPYYDVVGPVGARIFPFNKIRNF